MNEYCPFSPIPCIDASIKIERNDCKDCLEYQPKKGTKMDDDHDCLHAPGVLCAIGAERLVRQSDCMNCNTNRHGHPMFYQLCNEEMDLHSRKNHDYAKGGNPLGNFQRVAKILSLYPNLRPSNPAVVAITYMLKQLDATLWILSNGHQAQVEGHKERWQDISVYSKIISILLTVKE